MRTTNFDLIINEAKNQINERHTNAVKSRNRILNDYIRNINKPENYDTYHNNRDSLKMLTEKESDIYRFLCMQGVWIEYLKVFSKQFTEMMRKTDYDVEYDLDEVVGEIMIFVNDTVIITLCLNKVDDIMVGNQEVVTDTCIKFTSTIYRVDDEGYLEQFGFNRHKMTDWKVGVDCVIQKLLNRIDEVMDIV